VQPLLPKLKSPRWEPNRNHWHNRHKRFATRTVTFAWQTQRFIQTTSCKAVP